MYYYRNKNGSEVWSEVEPHQDTWLDLALFHLLWSWSYTLKKIIKELMVH